MALYEVTSNGMSHHGSVDFATVEMRERQDLQRLLRENIAVLDGSLLVVAEEFGEWEDARRRIDLLAVDKSGQLVVIELKRTEDAGHAELQALRYAAMVSAMTFDQVVDAYEHYLSHYYPDEETEARSTLLDFLDADPESASDDVAIADARIILVAAGFSREMTTTVLWLNQFEGLDIRCVRMVPYKIDSRTLIDVQQIIPLPEAADYQVRVRRKDAERERARNAQSRDFTRYHIIVGEHVLPDENKRNAVRVMVEKLVEQGVPPSDLIPIVRESKLRTLEGEYTEPEALRSALVDRYPGIRPKRFFIEEPIIQDGTTYVLSKMWGRQTEPTLEALVQRFPDAQVSFRRVPE